MGCTFIKSKKQHQLESLDTNISVYGSQKALANFNVKNDQRKEKFKIHLNPIVVRRSLLNRKISRIQTA